MVDWTLLFYRAMRDFFYHVYPHVDAFFYWDRKVLARREELKKRG